MTIYSASVIRNKDNGFNLEPSWHNKAS